MNLDNNSMPEGSKPSDFLKRSAGLMGGDVKVKGGIILVMKKIPSFKKMESLTNGKRKYFGSL